MTRSKDKRDVYYRKAKEEGYRARSAYKLLQLNDEFQLFEEARVVVDLCAAPGSWSQVASQLLRATGDEVRDSYVIAIDLQEIAPISGVRTLQGDITQESTLNHVLRLLDGRKADIVLCDGAPDVTGLHDLDEYVQYELLRAALRFCGAVLRDGGTFVAKIFRGYESAFLYAQIRSLFREVYIAKPRSSRNSSLESFVVCRGFNLGHTAEGSTAECGSIPPFVACGDLSSEDPDMAYDLAFDSPVSRSEDKSVI